MQRRHFLAASLATSALGLSRDAAAQTSPPSTREYYQLRRYRLQSGPQTKLAEAYFESALVPALTRLGMGPVGAFKLDFGSETPVFYLLIPSPSLDILVNVDFHLAKDEAFMKAAAPFWGAPATAPPYVRVESSLLSAFDGWLKLKPPASSATKAKRIFQLRTYESPTDGDHVRKVEMFNNGEFEIFEKAGCSPLFFADTLIGERLPSLTYMLSFANTAALEAGWAAFIADPAWKKLSSSPRYSYEDIVSNVTNLILSPLAASQL